MQNPGLGRDTSERYYVGRLQATHRSGGSIPALHGVRFKFDFHRINAKWTRELVGDRLISDPKMQLRSKVLQLAFRDTL
jgi:hypothetical protein